MKQLKIGIIGSGFSGTSLAALLHKMNNSALEITLFEKRPTFAVGDPYSTPYYFHLLNVRAHDMSAFEDEPNHFVNWLNANPHVHAHLEKTEPFAKQFVPRRLYGDYLKTLLHTVQTHESERCKLNLEASEVIEVIPTKNQVGIRLANQKLLHVDKLVIATGNNPPQRFPFPIAPNVNCIKNPWDYTAIENIPSHEPVLIVGIGLSMIDTVLTLHQRQHQGPIYAVSRHGLLPLPHSDNHSPLTFSSMPSTLRWLVAFLRQHGQQQIDMNGDWRIVINAMRHRMQATWKNATLVDRKRFLRHVLSYWNVHRHRVPTQVSALLNTLVQRQQLKIMAGRVARVEDEVAHIKLRGDNQTTPFNMKWLINCMGPGLDMTAGCQPFVNTLLQQGAVALDPLQLGFATDAVGAIKNAAGEVATNLYATATLRRGELWECTAVPDIRKQNNELAKILLNLNANYQKLESNEEIQA